MNSTIYLFGKFGQGITASVNDYTKSFFEEFISKANAPTQIIIHRNGAIMNYGYIRKIEDGHLFGICVQINGQYLSTTKKLFEVFENIVANIAVRGDILHINRKGNLEASTPDLLNRPEELERAIVNCQNEFTRLTPALKTLPDIDFSTADSDVNYFKESDNSKTIINTSVKNGYTFIYKEQDYDTLALGGYRSTLSALNKENETYKKRISEQENKLRILERKKKQMGIVVALLVALFVGSIVFFNTIEEKNEDIAVRERTIDRQKVENYVLNEEKEEVQKENTQLQGQNRSLVAKQEMTSKELGELKSEYERLKKENDCYEDEAKALASKNSRLESELNKAKTDLARKNADYKTLQSKYDQICNQLTLMENKYYSTKEGKKELKR